MGATCFSCSSKPFRIDTYLVTSTPPASTNHETPTVLGWGFFLPDRAGSRVFLGVPAEAYGLRRSASQPIPSHIPLSPGHSSLRPRSLLLARSPQMPHFMPIQIKALRTDESSGLMKVSLSGAKLRLVRLTLYPSLDTKPHCRPVVAPEPRPDQYGSAAPAAGR